MDSGILIIGSGIAGLTSAIFLAEEGFDVLIATRSPDPSESNTRYAQGGIVGPAQDDTPSLLEKDIFEAGARFGDRKAIGTLVKEGPPLVKEFLIEHLKVPFAKTLTKEGGHRVKRIYFSADQTGWAIEKALLSEVKKHPNIRLFPNHTAIDLITISHHSPLPQAQKEGPKVVGAYLLDNRTRRVKKILAQKTILAAGGSSALYLYTTNPEGARGDGIAMAHRAGAKVKNLEFIQFHPTAFYHKDAPRFLLTEALRGEGAVLKNKKGKIFVNSLATRDEVARAIYNEMILGGQDHVFLDATALPKKGVDLPKRFPYVFRNCLNYGIDIRKDFIPVVPAAHYSCGGLNVDLWGRTNLPNLYAIGEVSCTGVHGANRLASTSLLEGLLWGKRSAEDISRRLNPTGLGKENLARWKIPEWRDEGLSEEVDPALLAQDLLTIRSTLWNYVGIVRTKKRLERAVSDLSYLRKRIDQFYRQTKLTDALAGLRNASEVALLIAQSALKNQKSAGCHYRTEWS